MDDLTQKVHDLVPTIFLILKSRNRKQYDMTKRLVMDFHQDFGQIVNMIAQEQQEYNLELRNAAIKV